MNRFVSSNGDFISDLANFEAYFPLSNFRLTGSVTPYLNGDLKLSNNEFFFEPATRFGLSANKLGINIWAVFRDSDMFSLLGKSSTALNAEYPVKKRVEAGILWYKLANSSGMLNCEITSFVDINSDVQWFSARIENAGKKDLVFNPVIVTPVYGRSADNIRDHRHVTSLLNRVKVYKNGIVLKPTMSFNEEGHKINDTNYCVFVSSPDVELESVFSDYNEVIGGGDLLSPCGVCSPGAGRVCVGGECCFAGRFSSVLLKPGRSIRIYFVVSIVRGDVSVPSLRRLCSGKKAGEKFQSAFEKTKSFWEGYVSRLEFLFPEERFSNWMKWVVIQPLLRKIYGCSFLPDFDYGRGGRGWRDLWQDLLSLLLANPDEVRGDLIGNFAGIRIDGSNATIIGKRKGEFIADRNRITRVWMDHGVWPFLTTLLYIDQTGDWKVLFEKTYYFKDNQIFRAKRWDVDWDGNTVLTGKDGRAYKGTILEHILLQHLVQFFNVGRHNLIKLENADWNDGLDMAPHKGESAAFTSFYLGNLEEIADLLEDLRDRFAVKKLEFFDEMYLLMDSISGAKVNYGSYRSRQRRLLEFFDRVQVKGFSGKLRPVEIDSLISDLRRKADALRIAVRKQIVRSGQDMLVNGYFDDDGEALEGIYKNKADMTLTGQVFPIMKGVLSVEEAKAVARTVDKYLFDKKIKGYRLNTDFGRVLPKMGRAFAFAFGEKENGAVFSHMVVMYANALFKRGLVEEGWKALESLFDLAMSENAGIYPCLPEYFNNQGKGMYAYLTGSASWYVMTLLREAVGISSVMGDLFIFPKLLGRHFSNSGKIEVISGFRGYKIRYRIINKDKLSWPDYCVCSVKVNGEVFRHNQRAILFEFESLRGLLDSSRENIIEVVLGKCAE